MELKSVMAPLRGSITEIHHGPESVEKLAESIELYKRLDRDEKDAEIDALRTRLEDTVRDSTDKIEALRAEVDQYKRRADAYFQTAERQGKRAERLAEALREATAMLLADYPETAKRLRAALRQENSDD
jgi:methyl-accepting chemotaxis protein